jgi:two-component sensor histidine kinase
MANLKEKQQKAAQHISFTLTSLQRMQKTDKIQLEPQEEIRFEFVRKTLLAGIFVCCLLVFLSFFGDNKFTLLFILTMFSVLIGYIIILKHKSKYQLVVKFVFIFIFGFSGYSVLFTKNVLHYQEIYWMLVVALFSFFILKKIWGGAFLSLLILTYIFYFSSFFKQNIASPDLIGPYTQFIWSIQFTISMALIAYLMFQYIQANKAGLNQIIQVNRSLEEETQTIEKQNIEKITLLQEVHHRVKNNLQIIISLLRMQLDTLQTEEAKMEIQQSIYRILSLSLVHQKLYESKTLSKINVKDYLITLAEQLQIVENKTVNVSLKQNEAEIFIATNKAIFLGLLINELIEQTLHHNHENKSKETTIEIKLYPDNRIALEFSNNNLYTIQYNEMMHLFVAGLKGEIKETVATFSVVFASF